MPKQTPDDTDHFRMEWLDFNRAPRCAPDPAFPEGIDVDISQGAELACTVRLPYPVQGCGAHFLECRYCTNRVQVSTAGRPDDPRSLRLPCRFTDTPGRA